MKFKLYIKILAVILIIAVLSCAGIGIYAYINTKLQVVSVKLERMISASENTADFYALQSQIDNNASTAAVYTTALSSDPSDYSFFVYRIQLHNNGLIRAEMVEAQPYVVNGDALSYSTLDVSSLNANTVIEPSSDISLSCVILTDAVNQSNRIEARTFKITYYIWGIPMSVVASYK